MHGPSLSKQPTFRDATRLVSREISSEKRLQKSHTDDRSGSASDWLKQISFTVRPVRITTQIQVVTHLCSRFPDVISRGKTSGGVAKCRLFSQAGMAPCSPFCISSDKCRIKILVAKLHPYSLQTVRCYAWHQFESTLCSRQLRNLLLEQHSTIKTSFSVRFAYMNECVIPTI